MATKKDVKPSIFFVDDEESMREVVCETLERLDVEVTSFSSARDCLEQLRYKNCNLLITDVKMPDMDGLTLAEEAKRIAPWVEVLVVSGYGDIPMAVRSLKIGAVNFLEKPLGAKNLLAAVKSALTQVPVIDPLVGKELTRAEMRILYYVMSGNSNRQTASILNRSEKTIEVHRNHLMRKLGVDNVVGLVKRAVEMGLGNLSPK